ncbi:hypothetical protein ACH5RR_008055 [Cinchona calisaya]|uniref:TATA element modulatory factor 1 TATA binding domain-containing protein n=1 Tax=Cinchona calisaya TaxID=153742 RepID=A0ABD3AB01_9GENT
MGRKAESWAAVEGSVNSQLQDAEVKAAAAAERDRSINERLSQTSSLINVLEAQMSCLRAVQTQLTRSLEKERQKQAENWQEYLALKEEADTNEGISSFVKIQVSCMVHFVSCYRVRGSSEFYRSVFLCKARGRKVEEVVSAELEREKAAGLDQERLFAFKRLFYLIKAQKQSSSCFRKWYSQSWYCSPVYSISSRSPIKRFSKNVGEGSLSPYYTKSITPGAFESALRQKQGELASYMSRLASMESIHDSFAEELVKMTVQCEKLRAESSLLPGLRAELEALRRRLSAALELMGECDEELEELGADIIDLKMYREQVNLLVNKTCCYLGDEFNNGCCVIGDFITWAILSVVVS